MQTSEGHQCQFLGEGQHGGETEASFISNTVKCYPRGKADWHPQGYLNSVHMRTVNTTQQMTDEKTQPKTQQTHDAGREDLPETSLDFVTTLC